MHRHPGHPSPCRLLLAPAPPAPQRLRRQLPCALFGFRGFRACAPAAPAPALARRSRRHAPAVRAQGGLAGRQHLFACLSPLLLCARVGRARARRGGRQRQRGPVADVPVLGRCTPDAGCRGQVQRRRLPWAQGEHTGSDVARATARAARSGPRRLAQALAVSSIISGRGVGMRRPTRTAPGGTGNARQDTNCIPVRGPHCTRADTSQAAAALRRGDHGEEQTVCLQARPQRGRELRRAGGRPADCECRAATPPCCHPAVLPAAGCPPWTRGRAACARA